VGDNFLAETAGREKQSWLIAFVVAIFLSVLFCAGLALRHFTHAQHTHQVTIDGRVNPNFAPAASLVRLPGIGLGRAEAIVAYREDFRVRYCPKRAFAMAEDLCKVRGIGPKTSKKISKWLRFD